ncbi:MAG: tetratricopeptide repeat protein [Rhodospirillales bacterium]|nr:tetratricopeptide repeat protein [Rhodospirillales bacterium]
MARKSVRFGSFTLDVERFSLQGSSGRLNLRPKSFEVLLYLVERAGEIVAKDEVMQAVWSDVTVTDESLTRCISEIRHALGDEGQSIIKTVPRRGYCFDLPVSADGSPAVDAMGQAAPRGSREGTAREESEAPSAVRPSIAVLPFTNMSGDPEQEYFSDGITEDIITDLAKISGLRVIARNWTFTYKGGPVNVQQVSGDLKVRFLLEGSVRKAGPRVRVTAQLVDGASGGHLWADRYDRDLIDIFAIQDEITHTIVDQLKVKLQPNERRAIDRAPTDNLDAYGYYLRGRQFLHRHSRPYYALAKRMFARAVELDPLYARAHAGIADCDSFLFLHYNPDVRVDDILASSARALELDAELAEAHASRGLALSLCERHQESMGEFDQALALDPNLFEAHYFYARAFFAQGKLAEAAAHFERAAEIKPDDYQALLVVPGVYRSLGRQQDMRSAARRGVERAERALERHPENSRPAYLGAIGLATLGELDRAKDWAERALAIDPDDGLAKYNVACFYSLVGEHDRAIHLLLDLLPSASPERRRWVKRDSDLDPIRSHPRFAEVLALTEQPISPREN